MKAPYARCSDCPLMPEPFVPGCGPSDAKIIAVGEAPGAQEAKEGKPFVGPSGKLLDYAILAAGGDTNAIYKTNVVLCRPPGNRQPTDWEIGCCSTRLINELQEHTAPTIVTLGRVASDQLIPSFDSTMRGQWYKFAGRFFLPTWHPAYVLRQPSEMDVLVRDLRVALRGYVDEPLLAPPQVHVARSLDELRQELSTCPSGATVAFDIETDQTQWYDTPQRKADAIVMMGIAWKEAWGLALDDVMLYDVPGVIGVLQEFFDRTDIETVAHNGKFDQIFLEHHFGLKIRLDFDTMLAHYVLNENQKHGLKEIAMDELGIPNYENELIKRYLRSRNDQYSKIPWPQLSQYCIWDVVVTRKLKYIFEERLKTQGLYDKPFKSLIMSMSEFLKNVEMLGIKVDVKYLQNVSQVLDGEKARVVAELCRLGGVSDLNPNSPQQVAAVLYDRLQLPMSKSKRVKPRSTNEEAVMHLKGKHAFVDKLLYYRSVAKLQSSYIENMLYFIDREGRTHPSYKIHGTEIGRISATDWAAQTTPRPGDKKAKDYSIYTDGAMIRGAIVPAEGFDLIVADFSQAELRVCAALSGEPFLLDVYNTGRDLHTEVAVGMFGSDYTKEQRVQCKMFNFSYLYGGSEYSFALDAGLPIAVARKFVRDYNELMPRLAQYRIDQFNKLVEQGYVESIFGRRRRFPIITEANHDEARKAAVHAPVAGTASDLTQLAGIRVQKEGLRVILTVHDSVLVEAPKSESQALKEYLPQVMCEVASTYLPEVKWKADADILTRWAEPPILS